MKKIAITLLCISLISFKATCNTINFPTKEIMSTEKEMLRQILQNSNISEKEKLKSIDGFADNLWQFGYPNIKDHPRITTESEFIIFQACKQEIIDWEMRKTSGVTSNIFGILKSLREQRGFRKISQFKNYFNNR